MGAAPCQDDGCGRPGACPRERFACKGGDKGEGGDLREVGRYPVTRRCRSARGLRAGARRRLGLAALALAALTVVSAPGEANPRVSGAAASHGRAKAKAAEPPSGPLLAVVSIARQRIQLYDGKRLLAQSPVSTGRVGFRTPTGVFSILQKRRYHESNIYSVRAARGDAAPDRGPALGRGHADRLRPGHQRRDRAGHRLHRAHALRPAPPRGRLLEEARLPSCRPCLANVGR
jgi:L,D-transpeptidase-like protein